MSAKGKHTMKTFAYGIAALGLLGCLYAQQTATANPPASNSITVHSQSDTVTPFIAACRFTAQANKPYYCYWAVFCPKNDFPNFNMYIKGPVNKTIPSSDFTPAERVEAGGAPEYQQYGAPLQTLPPGNYSLELTSSDSHVKLKTIKVELLGR
jgi:hypothetical protein